MGITLNQFGYYEVEHKPSNTELQAYYEQKYYQLSLSTYNKTYSSEELLYFKNKIEQKKMLAECFLKTNDKTLLDVGCGEGFTLQYFKDICWEVLGLDYSNDGCKSQNPQLLPQLITGDVFNNLDKIIEEEQKFAIVWLDNVLEHVIDPLLLLNKIKKCILSGGVLMVEVPNDFSDLQKKLLHSNKIDNDFWVALPDHLSYFNKQGLINLASHAGLSHCKTIADFPIDWFLVNSESNYIVDRRKGKQAHQTRVFMENLIHEKGHVNVTAFYESLANIGLGRQIISVFQI
jgi:2-polyprenyl-3-methyl-5-hydroxy-6-metoxy-1,4-benzoquinol methylase